MSNVPAAVRKQIKAANREIQQLQEGKHATQAQPTAAPQPGNPPPVVALQPVPNFATVGAEVPAGAVVIDPVTGRPPAAPAPAVVQVAAPTPRPAAPAPAAASAPPPGAQPVPAAVDFEHKYRVLEGKYAAERRRDAQAISALQQQLSAVRAVPAAAPAPASAPVQLTDDQRFEAAGLTKAEVEEYGPELVKMIMRVAGNIAAPEIRRIAAEQQRLSGQVNVAVQSANKTARELLWDALADQVPDWELTNNSQEFLDWLGEVDIISGLTRRAGLMNAFEANDAMRVIGIFKVFKAEDERAQSTTRQPQVDPVTLIAPGQPAQSATPAPAGDQGGPMIPEQEVRTFYADVRRGRIKGQAKIDREAEINLALVQGRIIPEHSDAHLLNSR